MAKDINVKIAIDKEAEFKRALQQIGGELKTLGAEAKKLQAIYAEDANSYTALSAKLKNLGEQYEKLTEKLEEQKRALENQNNLQKLYESQTEGLKKKAAEAAEAYKTAAEKTDDLKKAMEKANVELKDNERSIDACKSRIQTYERQIISTETEQIKLGREIDKTSGYLREAATSADGTAHSIDKYGKEVKDAAEDTKSFTDAADLLAKAIVASGAVEGAEKLRDAIIATAKASIEYESAFAGVRKTVDGTAEELTEISDGIKQMATDIPIGTTALAGIAEAAGQLGIAREDVLDFTQVMADLSVTTNLSSEEAASSLAKFANITKMSTSEYSNLGSSIVALGNNFATTEADIVAMATRLASTGEVAGLTEPQILAIATALSSVGVEAEAGGSAFSKLLKTIATEVETGSESLKDYADVAGMSAEEFAAVWEKDAVGAVATFILGLGRLDSQGGSAIATLESLGLSEVRLSNAVLALASSEDILTKALDLSNTAWAENTALAEEAAIRYETTESKLQLLENSFNNLKITVGDELVGTFGGAIDGLTDLTQAADEYVQKNPDVVAGLTAVAAGLGGLAVAGTVIPLITTLWGLLTANPVGLAVTAIAALVTGLTTYALTTQGASDKTKQLVEESQKFSEKIRELRDDVGALQREYGDNAIALETQNSKLEEAVRKVEELGKKTNLTASENAILEDSIKTLNGAIPGLNLNYSTMSGNIEDVVFNLRILIEMQKEYASLENTTNALLDAEGMQSKLDASAKAAQSSLEELKESLEDYELLKERFLEEKGDTIHSQTGLSYEEMQWSPYDEDIKLLEQQVAAASEAYNNAAKLRRDNIERIAEYENQINELDSNILAKAEEFKVAMDALNVESEASTEAANTITEAADKTTAAVTKTAKTTKVTVDEAGQSIIDHAKIVQTNLDALTKEYDSAYKSAQSALGGIGGLFGEVAFKTEKSISDMLSGLDSQADYFTGYMLNLQRASQIGIDEGLVAALADGSDESAGYLQKIIDEFNKLALEFGEGSPEAEAFVTDFNTKFEATSKAKDALAATMAGISTNFEERASDILGQADDLITELSGYSGNAYDEVSKAVSETLTAIADGFGQFQTAAQEKSQGIIDAANYIKTGINTTLEVLPDEMRVAGQNVSLGLSEGILSKMGDVEETVRRLAQEAILGAAKDELGIHSPSEEGREIGKFYDEGIAQGIERNQNTVISANLEMISNLEAASQSAAKAAGTSLGNTMAQAMSAALSAGQALRQAVESGSLTVDGKVVKTAESVGIPSLTGQAALDWNAEQKRDFNLPDDWSNQDIVDWLNAGGAMSGGMSSETKANIENAIASESSGANVLVTVSKLGNKGADGKTWGYGTTTKYNPNLSEQNIGKSRVQVTQNFYGTQSAYQVKKAAEEGVTNAVYK